MLQEFNKMNSDTDTSSKRNIQKPTEEKKWFQKKLPTTNALKLKRTQEELKNKKKTIITAKKDVNIYVSSFIKCKY